MCGIVGYIGPRPALDVLLGGLERLEYRGYDSVGVAIQTPEGLAVRKVVGRVPQLRCRIDAARLEGGCGVGHTRWATHGAPSDRNAHPHSDCSGAVAVVHNGTIENFDALLAGLEERGHDIRSETDTEVVAHL
ncbi:MAG TPA: glutamine--fructose-6-phosphate aminotransferase, partial [Gemmatimonadales bacterium]|nr:glutamine--fructose-6-phosphate aminotransferase [Gemmatimonadales bacterium]